MQVTKRMETTEVKHDIAHCLWPEGLLRFEGPLLARSVSEEGDLVATVVGPEPLFGLRSALLNTHSLGRLL